MSMSLKKYFDILGLPDNAGQDEIRRQYRKLAMRLHPDKNPASNAKEQFIKITEAYEILIGKRPAPSVSQTHISRSKEKTNEERVKEARERYYEQILKEKLETERYFKSLFRGKKWKLLKITSVVGPILSLLLILDFFLPRHFEPDRISQFARKMKSGDPLVDVSLIRTVKENDYWIGKMDFKLYGIYPDIIVERSWIFHEPINVISAQKVEYAYYPVDFTFLSMSAIIIMICLLPLITRLYKRKTVWYTVLYHTSLYLSTIMILLFIIMNDHWAHLLVMGFF